LIGALKKVGEVAELVALVPPSRTESLSRACRKEGEVALSEGEESERLGSPSRPFGPAQGKLREGGPAVRFLPRPGLL